MTLLALAPAAAALGFDLTLEQSIFGFGGGGSNPSGSYALDAPAKFEEVTVSTQIKHHHNCGNSFSFHLFANGSETLSQGWSNCQKSGSAEFTFDLNDLVGDAFTWEGYVGSQSSGLNWMKVDLLPKRIMRLKTTNTPQSVGTVGSLLNVSAAANRFDVSSSDPEVLVWFGTEEDIGTQETDSPDAQIWQCADTNSDGACDAEAAAPCEDAGGAWYKDVCCGVTVGTNTLCGYYSSFNAWCGKNSEGAWEWALAKDRGAIHRLTECPGTTMLGGGDLLYRCGPTAPSTSPFPASSSYVPYGLGSPVQLDLIIDTSGVPNVTVSSVNITILCNDCADVAVPKDISVADNTFFLRQWDGTYLAGPSATTSLFPGTYEIFVDAGDKIRFSGGSASATQFFFVNDAGTLSVPFTFTGASDGFTFTIPEHGKLRFAEGYTSAVTNFVTIASKVHYVLVEETVGWTKSGIYCRLYNSGKYPPGTYGTDLPTGSTALPGDTTTIAENTPSGGETTVTKTITDGLIQYGWGADGCYADGSYTCTASSTNDACASFHAKVWRQVPLPGFAHEYYCDGSAISECAGSQEPFSDIDFKATGTSVQAGNATYYCASDADYSTDLDSKDAASCDLAGFAWTGTKCCSEADDLGETYQDPGMIGACWNKVFVQNSNFTANNSVFAKDGTFQGCKVSGLRLDTHNGQSLPTSNPVCTVYSNAHPQGQVFCSNAGKWQVDQFNSNRSINKSIAWSVNGSAQKSDCCSATSCWTGSMCQANQVTSASPLNYNGYRCENGAWIYRPTRYTWDRLASGFCPTDTQCLVDPNGAAANNNNPSSYFDPSQFHPQCIADGQSILDHQCESGTWSTRTKQLALVLLNYSNALSPTDYRLFCGTAAEALNNPSSVASFTGSASCVIQPPGASVGTNVPCVNNFCVLTTETDVAWGVTLNKPVNDATKSFLTAINKSATFCDNVLSAPGWAECSGMGSGVWYNPVSNALIVIPSGVIGTVSLQELFNAFIQNPLDAIKLFVFTKLHSPAGGNDYSFFNSTHTFNKLYAGRKGSSQLFAFLEENIYENSIRRDYIGAQYANVDLGSNPCLDIILRYDNLASCNSTTTSMTMVRQRVGPVTTPSPLLQAWRDLTAKLRPG